MKKISTENLNRLNAGIGIVGGVLSIGFAVWQIITTVQALKAQKREIAMLDKARKEKQEKDAAKEKKPKQNG